MKSFHLVLILLWGTTIPVFSQSAPRKTEADALVGRRLSAPSQRAQVVREVEKMLSDRRAKGQKRARELGIPSRRVRSDGTVSEVVDLDEKSNQPVFMKTHNSSAAVSTGANVMRMSLGLSGQGVVVGVWDGGVARSSHQEFTGARVKPKDSGGVIDHATHVAGTIAGNGTSASALGMAPSVIIDAYDWNSDTAEMIARAATSSTDPGKIRISNHSYGYVRGWEWNGSMYAWSGFAGNTASSTDSNFGLYASRSRTIDSIAYNAPYYLMFFSAGNDRNNNPTTGSSVLVGGVVTAYNRALHPPGDGTYRGGYDTISDHAVSKNAMIVGATADAIASGTRDPSRALLTSFTSWGPTDDGRIKPDVVANGASVYSSTAVSDSSYSFLSGTSMAAPNASGTAALLVEHYSNLFPGQSMRSSTLRGLLIHTATDRGRPGPDYQYGWGLIDGASAATLLSDHASNPTKQRLSEETLVAGQGPRLHRFVWDGSSPIRVTICWNDPPGSSRSLSDDRTKNLVNDLNIRLVSPTGTEFFPYVMPFVGTWTQASMEAVATTGVNSTDNVEQIYVAAPSSPGVYELVVNHGGTLTGGSQVYSLLVSGSANFNSPPSIDQIPDISVQEDTPALPIGITVSDAETPPDQLQVTVRSDNPSLADLQIAQETSGGRVLRITPNPDAHGVAAVTIEVSDGEMTTSTVFSLQVSPVNDPPVISFLSPLSLLSLDPSSPTAQVAFIVSDVDHPAQEISVTALSDNPSMFPSLLQIEGDSSSRVLTLSAAPDAYGRSVITIEATDGELSAQVTFEVSVPNPHPTFTEWISPHLSHGDAGFHGDLDADGLSNALEYFHGTDPSNPSEPSPVSQDATAAGIVFEYRKNRFLNGVSGGVRWSDSLSTTAVWTSSGVSESVVMRNATYEWRRALIPWPTGRDKIFVKIELDPQ